MLNSATVSVEGVKTVITQIGLRCLSAPRMIEDLRVREVIGEILEVGTDGGIEPVGEILLVGNAGEEFLSNEDPSIGDGDGEDHDVVDVAGLDVAVPVEVAAEDEVEQFLGVTDTTRRIAFGLGLRSGLRSGEIVQVTPADVTDGPAGMMVRVRKAVAKGDKHRESPLPADLATHDTDGRRRTRGAERCAARRREHADAPTVDRRSRRETRRGDRREGWRDLTAHDLRRTWTTALAGNDGVDALLCASEAAGRT